jgi:hypothetical protein
MRLITWTRKAFLLRVLVAALCVCAHPLWAQTIVDTPVLNPAAPIAGQTVNVDLHGSPCVLYLTPPDYPSVVTRDANAITLVVQAYVSSDPDFCIYPTFTISYPIGAFGPGHYTVQVDAQYPEFLGGTITQTLGTLPFNVSAPRPVPALSGLMLVLLTLLIGVAVWIMARHGVVSFR